MMSHVAYNLFANFTSIIYFTLVHFVFTDAQMSLSQPKSKNITLIQ